MTVSLQRLEGGSDFVCRQTLSQSAAGSPVLGGAAGSKHLALKRGIVRVKRPGGCFQLPFLALRF